MCKNEKTYCSMKSGFSKSSGHGLTLYIEGIGNGNSLIF